MGKREGTIASIPLSEQRRKNEMKTLEYRMCHAEKCICNVMYTFTNDTIRQQMTIRTTSEWKMKL
jgi:hypothetical protein